MALIQKIYASVALSLDIRLETAKIFIKCMLTMPISGYGCGQMPNMKAPANPSAVLEAITGLGVLFVPLFVYGLYQLIKIENNNVYRLCTLLIVLVGCLEYLDMIPKTYHILATVPAFLMITIIDKKEKKL